MASINWQDKFNALKVQGHTNDEPKAINTAPEVFSQADDAKTEGGGSMPPSVFPQTSEAIIENIGEKETEASSIVFLSPYVLDEYQGDPFREYTGQRLEQLVESIRGYGVLTPIIVRPKPDGRYEILSGRNRNNSAKVIGMDQVPCIIKDVDDNEAALIVTESNLKQRENLLPSEKAFAYKMQFEALKNQGKKHAFLDNISDFNQGNKDLCHDGKNSENNRTAYRYLRLTELTKELLQLVDDNILSLIAAEYISYLERGEQFAVIQYFYVEKRAALDVNTAKLLRERSQETELTYALIEDLLHKKKKLPVSSVNLKMTKLQKYVPKDIFKKSDIEKYIVQALDFYTKYLQNTKGNASDEQG